MSDDPIIDRSHVNSYLRSRHRVEVLNASWRPALAGAAGATAIIAAMVAGVWIAGPHFTFREIEIPKIVVKDTPFDNYVPHTKSFDPPTASKPVASAPAGSPYAPRTPEEKPFTDRPEYRGAKYHGRIVKSRDGHELSFEDGRDFHPGHWDSGTGTAVADPEQVIPSDEFIGDLGLCLPEKGHAGMWVCDALHNGRTVRISGDAPVRRSSAGPTSPATEMVAVDIKVGNYPVEAMVDTGCAWPMAVPKIYADALVRMGLATRAGSSSTIFADGSQHAVGIIMISSINVDGRVLRDVEASVSPSNEAPILLGLGALNRLGAYSITGGKLTFIGEQPA